MKKSLGHILSFLMLVTATPTCADEPHVAGKERFIFLTGKLYRSTGPECYLTVEETIEKSRKECPEQPAFIRSAIVPADSEQSGEFRLPFSMPKPLIKKDQLDIFKTPTFEKRVSVHLPDLLLLLERSASCDPKSTFNKSFEQFLNARMSLKEIDDQYVGHLKYNLKGYRDQISDLESNPQAHNAFLADLARVRHTMMVEQKFCRDLLPFYDAQFGLLPQVEAFYKKIQGKEVSSLDDLYQLADDQEKKLLDLLFGRGGRSPAAFNMLDFALGSDRGNHLRNVLLHGRIPFGKDKQLSISPTASNSLFKSPLLKSDGVKRVAEILSRVGSPDPTLGFYNLHGLEDFLKQQLPQDRNNIRRYLAGIVSKLETVGIAQDGPTDQSLLGAERVRTVAHRLLSLLDSQVPEEDSFQADIFKQMVPDEKLALLTEADTKKVSPHLLRGAVRTPLQGPTPFGDSMDLMDVKNLEYVLKSGEKDKVHAMSQVDLTEEDMARMQKNLAASRELYVRGLDHDRNLKSPYFYGRDISAENKKLNGNEHWESAIDRIAEALGTYKIGLTAKDRMRLRDSLDPFTLDILGTLMKVSPTTTPDYQNSPFRKGIRPTLQELAKMAFEPEGKADLIQAMGILTQMGADGRGAVYEVVASNLSSIKFKLPEGFKLEEMYKAPASERDAVAAQAEELLRSDKSLTEWQKRALAMLSHLLREEGHDPELLYAGNSLPALISELSLRDQSTKHDIRKKQRDEIEASGTDGKKAVTSLDNVEQFLKRNNYGLPINAEMGLLQFLARNGKTGDEAIRQLMASVPPKVFANAIAQLRPVNSDQVIQQTLRDYLPHSLYLVSNPQVTKDRVFAQAVRDLHSQEKLSEATLSQLDALLIYFPECTVVDADKVQECVMKKLYDSAARYTLEKGDSAKADRLLAKHEPDATKRANRIDEMSHQNDSTRGFRQRVEEKGIAWAEVLKVLHYTDVDSAAEQTRIEQLTSWARDHRSTERALLERETQRNTELTNSTLSYERAATALAPLEQKLRKAFSNLTDDKWKELVAKWEEIRLLQPKLAEAGNDSAGIALKNKWKKLRLETMALSLHGRTAHYIELDDIDTFLRLKGERDSAQNNYFSKMNPNRGIARGLVNLAEAKAASELDAEGRLIDPQHIALDQIRKAVENDQGISGELEQLTQNFGLTGELRIGDKVYSTADLEDLMARVRKAAGHKPPPTTSLAARAKTIIDNCAAKPEECLLSAAKLTELKKLYADQSSEGDHYNLDRAGSLETQKEADLASNVSQKEMRALQQFLLDGARNYERGQNGTHQDVALRRMGEKLFPDKKGAKFTPIDGAMRGMRDNIMWGRSIADSVAQSVGNNPPPIDQGPEKLKEWMKQNGYDSIYSDWKFHMTSGLNKHRVPEEQVDELFHLMLSESWGRESKAAARKKEIETKLASIVAPTHTRSSDKPLWDWDKANLHLLAPADSTKRDASHVMSQGEFTALLNEYAELNGISMHSLNPMFRRNVRGEEELHDLVHGTLSRSKYRWDTASINNNSYVSIDKDKATPDPRGISSVGAAYDFKNFKLAKPRMERQAKDLQQTLANNGELHRAIDRQGGSTEGMYRIWRALSNEDPTTENDSLIETMTNDAASGILEIGMMGDSPIKFNDKEMPAGTVAQTLRQDLKNILGKQSQLLKNVDLGYEMTEQGIWLAAGIVAGYGIAGVAVMGTELIAAKNGVQLALAGQRMYKAADGTRKAVTLGMRMEEALNGMANLNSASRLSRAAQAINTARNSSLVAKGLQYVNQSKAMVKAGLEGKLYEKGFDILTARVYMHYAQKEADAMDFDGNGVADWRDALKKGRPFRFKDAIKKHLIDKEKKNEQEAEVMATDIAAGIDSDDNGIPDMADINEFGMEPEKYTMGSLTKLVSETTQNAGTMAASPWAAGIAGRTFLRPLGRVLQRVGGGRLDAVPRILKSSESFAGMFGLNFMRSMVDSDPERAWYEELSRNMDAERIYKRARESGYNSTFTAPLDDLWAASYLAKNPMARGFQLWWRKSLINHGQDFLQGAGSVYFDGKYTSSNGRETKKWWEAGLLNMGSSFKLSQKASSPGNAALDLIPKIVAADIVAKAGTGRDSDYVSILDNEVDTPQGKRKIRDIIEGEANLDDYVDPRKHQAFFTIFNKTLIEKGVDPSQVSDIYRQALARAGSLERRFGEVTTFVNNVAYEQRLQDLLAGKISAEEVINTKDAASNPKVTTNTRKLRLHHMLTVGEVARSDGGGFVNDNVRNAVLAVAADFFVDPKAFEKYVLDHKSKPGQIDESMTLRMLAMEMMKKDPKRSWAKKGTL